jgi:hypothetical protein
MHHHSTSQNISDAILTGGLVAAPAWTGWLDQANKLLTSLTLIVGLILGLTRLWAFWREWREREKR